MMLHHHSSSTRTIIALIFCTWHNLPMVYSQSEVNCVDIPCAYKGECRDKFSECGAGESFCHSESLWIPECGGGGSLERPSSSGNNNDNTDANDHQNQSTSPPPPPTPQPTLRNTPNPTNRPLNRPTGGLPTLPPQLSSILKPPNLPTTTTSIPEASASPTTAFENWLSEQNGPKNEVDTSSGNEEGNGDYKG